MNKSMATTSSSGTTLQRDRPTNRGVRNGHAVASSVEGKPMKSFRKELWFETPGRRAFLNITPQVEVALKESDVQEGIALINAMHITASVFINDDEQGLHADYEAWLERLAPHEPVSDYHHDQTG